VIPKGVGPKGPLAAIYLPCVCTGQLQIHARRHLHIVGIMSKPNGGHHDTPASTYATDQRGLRCRKLRMLILRVAALWGSISARRAQGRITSRRVRMLGGWNKPWHAALLHQHPRGAGVTAGWHLLACGRPGGPARSEPLAKPRHHAQRHQSGLVGDRAVTGAGLE